MHVCIHVYIKISLSYQKIFLHRYEHNTHITIYETYVRYNVYPDTQLLEHKTHTIREGGFLCELRIVYVDGGGFLELLVAYIDGF